MHLPVFAIVYNKSKQGERKSALTGVPGKYAITGIVEAKVHSARKKYQMNSKSQKNHQDL
jgi:hypothetical protein